jgi:biopolymer transport protein ExbB
MSIHERMSSFAMLGAEWVLWVLVALSLIAVAIIVERSMSLLSGRRDSGQLRRQLLARLAAGDLRGARHLLQESPCVEARVAEAGLSGGSVHGAEERMSAATERERQQLEKRLAYLGTVGNNAPFVGLLGTVIGIIRAFHELDRSGGQLSTGLMTEVGEALVATAVGILVALPAVAFFNLFQRIIQARLGQAEALGREAIGYLKALQDVESR